MTRDRKKNTFDAVFDLFDSAKAFYEENEDTINEVMKGGKEVSLQKDELLKEVYKEEDKIIIVAETGTMGLSDIDFKFNEEEMSMTVTMGGESLKIMMPKDVEPKETEARIKNGTLRAEVPRETEEVDEDGSDE